MPSARESVIADAMAAEFFSVVPRTYETYCPIASRIALEVFHHFGVPANIMPCQLWHAAPGGCHVIGFIGHAGADKWDGHVICVTETVLVDGAVRGLHRDFALDVPAIVAVNRLTTPSQIIASCPLNEDTRLWWLNPPYGFDTAPPLQPVDLIADYAREIAARISKRLALAPEPRRLASVPHVMQVDWRAASS